VRKPGRVLAHPLQLARPASQRLPVAAWPPGPRRWADGRRGAPRWSIYALDWQAEGAAELRITPAGVDVMTPASAPGARWLAVATRAGNGFRRAAARCGARPRARARGAP
jgi:hypothetical protein